MNYYLVLYHIINHIFVNISYAHHDYEFHTNNLL